MSITKIWNKTWRDKYGHVVIWERPNIFLIGWVICFSVSLLLHNKLVLILEGIGLASLFVWGLLEFIKGENYFRKFFGLVGILIVIVFAIQLFS